MIPSNFNEIILNVIQEVYSKSLGTISISIIFTIWSAGKGVYALTKGLLKIYNINDDKTFSYIYLRIQVILYTIIFIILIFLGLIISIFGSSLIILIQNKFGILKNFSRIITGIVLLLATFVIFILVYKFILKNNVTFKSQFYGATFGAVALNLISSIFSKYLYIFKGFSITYGSLTTLILIMTWIYSCFYIIFCGAEINKLFNEKNV